MDFSKKSGISRRCLLKRAAAAAGSLSAAGLTGCGASGDETAQTDTSAQADILENGPKPEPKALPPAPVSSSPSPAPPPPEPTRQSSMQPFRNARTNARFALLRDAFDTAISGDTIKVAGGNYTIGTINDPGALYSAYGASQDTLTIEWETPGTMAVFDISVWAAANNAQGGDSSGIIMGPACRNLTVRGIGIRGNRAQGKHGNAGIYALPGYPLPTDYNGPVSTLTIEYCKFWEHTNGIITNSNHNGSIYLRYSTIQDCAADGLSHGCYIGGWAIFDVLGCTFKSTSAALPQSEVGHFLKSRAKTTKVRGCRFDGAYGCARLMDVSNGGNFECTGNVLLHYGPAVYADDNSAIRYAAEQKPQYRGGSPSFGGGTSNWVDDGRTHTILMAQNTVRKSQQAGGNPFEALKVDTPTDINDQPMGVTKTVRNNIVAGPSATVFVTTYPNNTEAAIANVGNDGVLSTGPIAGTANDASHEYVDELTPPATRSDRLMGGRSVLPAWVPAIPWRFTDIPGTRFNDFMKNDGTGIAPKTIGELPGAGSASYARQWDYSGAAYSPKRHELYMFGGGHNATTINALSRWNLLKDTPDMTLVSAPTPYETRLAEYVDNAAYNTVGYWSDGKPRSPHGYRNLQYFDNIDELVSLSLSAGDHPIVDMCSWNVTPGFQRGASSWRPNGYWPGLPEDPGQSLGIEMLVFPSYDQSVLYFTRGGGPLRKLVAATRTMSAIGTAPVNWTYTARGAARPDSSIALIVGGNESITGYRARFIDIISGAQTAVTVIGYAWPDGMEYHDMVWVPILGKFVALMYNRSYLNDQVVNDVRIVTLQPMGSSTLTAALVSTSGTAPSTNGGWVRGLYWDPKLGVLIVGNGPGGLLKAMRVG